MNEKYDKEIIVEQGKPISLKDISEFSKKIAKGKINPKEEYMFDEQGNLVRYIDKS